MTVEISRKTDKIVLARASTIELASVNLEIKSPVCRVKKKDMGNLKICLIYAKMTSIVNLCSKRNSRNSCPYDNIC